ncbi:MAG TPA: Ig-like domain-containing protein, partial [Longimicrobiales bacterium]
MRRILAAGAAALAAVVFVASCDDGFDRLPFEPEPPPEAPQAMVTCTVDVREATMTCGAPETDLPDEARGALTVGGQGEFVTLASSGVCYGAACEPDAPADIFRADVTVQNLIPQALGTTDGATGDTSGVRIFFHDAPTVTNGTGTVSVANEDGIGTFTGTGQPYFQYGGSVDDLLGPDDILSPSETSAPKTWEWKVPATVLEFEFSVYVHAEVQFPDGWIDVTPATQTLGLGAGDLRTVTLSGTVRDAVGREVTGGTLTWSSSDESVATVDASTGEVTAVAPGVATITATDGTVSGKAEITVAASLTDDAYAETVIGNVSINTAEAEGGPFTVVANDAFLEGDTISFAGWNGTAGTTEQGGDVVMTTSGAAMGQFTYDPPAGYTGADQFMYVIGEDTATVTLTVAGMIWFIDNEAAACTSVAAGCGRLSSPFSSLDAFKAVNNGMGNNPANGDAIFLYESATPYAGPLTLRMGQMLIGQDATGSLAGIIGITPSASSASLPATDGSTPDPTHTTIEGTTGGIVLGRDNTLRGLTVATTGGIGISGNGFGTLTLGGDVEVAAQNGAALQLSNGAFDGAFRSVSANGGTHGIVLSSTTGTFAVTGAGSAASGGTIENMTRDGISLTGTGPVELAWMAIRNNDGNGVFGFTVAGFTLRQSTV